MQVHDSLHDARLVDHDDRSDLARFEDVNGLGGSTVSSIGPRSPLFGQVRGAVVTSIDPGGPASASGLRVDDIIQSVNELTISEASQIREFAQLRAAIERARIIRAGTPYIIDFAR